MNWKKALLVFVVLLFGMVMLAAAAVGFAAIAGVAAVANVIDDVVVDTLSVAADGTERLEVSVDVPEVVVTDPESGRREIIVGGPRGESGRIVVDVPEHVVVNGLDHPYHWSGTHFFAPLGFLFRSFTTLVALGLIGLGAWLLLRNRERPAEKKADTA